MVWRRRLKLAAVIAFLGAYAGLSHFSNSTAGARDLGVILALAPVLTLSLALVWRWTRPAAAVVAAAALALLLHRYWPVLKGNFPAVYLFQETAFYGLMASSFGRSLGKSRVALCTRFADQIHGPLSPREVLYTRRVTLAWTLFFAAVTVVNLALFNFAASTIWSLFANFCVLPLIGVMFVAEYAVRRRVLPQVPRPGVFAAVRVYFAGSP
jgi:uncharacterized membrane protein